MTEPKKPKLADVRYQEVTYHPVADCEGRWEVRDDADVQVEECGWSLRAVPFGPMPGEFKKMARQHALDHPGHDVLVRRQTVSHYELPYLGEHEAEEVGDA